MSFNIHNTIHAGSATYLTTDLKLKSSTQVGAASPRLLLFFPGSTITPEKYHLYDAFLNTLGFSYHIIPYNNAVTLHSLCHTDILVPASLSAAAKCYNNARNISINGIAIPTKTTAEFSSETITVTPTTNIIFKGMIVKELLPVVTVTDVTVNDNTTVNVTFDSSVSVKSNQSLTFYYQGVIPYLEAQTWPELKDQNNTIVWKDIILAGHSQGGGLAAFLGQTLAAGNKYVAGIIQISAPCDDQETWIDCIPNIQDKYIGLGSIYDEKICVADTQIKLWKKQGIKSIQHPLNPVSTSFTSSRGIIAMFSFANITAKVISSITPDSFTIQNHSGQILVGMRVSGKNIEADNVVVITKYNVAVQSITVSSIQTITPGEEITFLSRASAQVLEKVTESDTIKIQLLSTNYNIIVGMIVQADSIQEEVFVKNVYNQTITISSAQTIPLNAILVFLPTDLSAHNAPAMDAQYKNIWKHIGASLSS